MTSFEKQATILEDILTNSEFNLPIQQVGDAHFPDFLRNRLDKYIDFIEDTVLCKIDEYSIFGRTDLLLPKIKELSYSLIDVINFYYSGKILESTKTFNDALKNIYFDTISISSEIEEKSLYRARRENGIRFSKSDLFHIRFEERHLVASNRYSVPGFPALYLGSSTYVCWEEFNRYNLRNLQFSRFKNTRKLKVIKLHRAEDLLRELSSDPTLKQAELVQYIFTFPLMIASSIKTKYPNGNFKPEYIIPQLLLQYVSKNSKIDGIKFLSTRVDYSRLEKVDAYNFVFPVKTNQKKGFCSKLVDLFEVTEPTSLMLEEISFNTRHTILLNKYAEERGQIELIPDVKNSYATTAFGRIEEALDDFDLSTIDNS